MMISEKLIACCRAALGSANTIALYVSSTAPDGAPPLPVVHAPGTLYAYDVSISSGALQFSGGALLFGRPQPSAVIGAQDFALDVFFDDVLPPIFAGFGESYGIVHCDSAASIIYVSTSGAGFEHSVALPAISAGTHHICAGRQAGVVSVWLDGVRIYRAPDTTPSVSLVPAVSIGGQLAYTGVVRDFRVTVGTDLYGDNATITMPTLPLGIV